MIPLPSEPVIVLLINNNDEVVGVASNVAPLPELKVDVTRSQRLFNELSLGKPFKTGADQLERVLVAELLAS